MKLPKEIFVRIDGEGVLIAEHTVNDLINQVGLQGTTVGIYRLFEIKKAVIKPELMELNQ